MEEQNLSQLPKLQPPYRSPINNRRYSKQLFYEPWAQTVAAEDRQYLPPFTLYRDKEGYVNFGREYVNDCDPTGYTTSTRLLGDFGYWEFLQNAGWFREAVETWNREIDARLKADGLRKIRELAEGDDPKALQAAKFLATLEHKKAAGPKRGRPSKEEIEGNLKNETQEAQQLREDAARIQLVRS